MAPAEQKVKEIKQSFRLQMDGSVAQAMRDKGLDYHLNWGVTLPRLREMADEIRAEYAAEGADRTVTPEGGGSSSPLYSLSLTLWKENVRECKILATMLMPASEILPEVVDIWMEQTHTLEIAEQAAFNLYQHLPYAADKAYQWLASPLPLTQTCGYHVLCRLFMQGCEPNERGISEFIDQTLTALQADDVPLRKAAMNAMIRFADLSLMHHRLAASALKTIGMTVDF